jgi:hypothetical protein
MLRSVTVCAVFVLQTFSFACTQQKQTKQDDVRLPSLESETSISAFKLTECQAALVHTGDGGERALKVTFAGGAKPSIEIRPADAPWNWSGHDRLALDVANPTGEEIGFRMRLDDSDAASDSDHSVGGGTTIAPRRSASVYLPFGSNSSTENGMRGAPAVAGLEPFTYLSMERLVDESHVVALRISASGARSGGELILKNLRLLRSTSYDRIVDDFGQYTRMEWPGKVKEVADLARMRDAEEASLKAAPSLPDRDEYGGWKLGPREKASGYFSTLRRGGKWWLVTPSGHLYLSLGVDVITLGDGPTLVEKRERMFSWLPVDGDPLAAHYGSVDNVLYGPVKKGKTFNFYTANLERKYGKEYVARWRSASLDRLRAWGFNTVANWSDPALYDMKRVPYAATIDLHGEYERVASGQDYWGKMHDPFDTKFAAAVDRSVREAVGRYRNDPWCIGYFIDNEISWGSDGNDRQRFGLVYGTLAGGKNSPAKKAMVQRLKKRYTRIASLNQSWSENFSSWDSLLEQPYEPRELAGKMREDFADFLLSFARQYFRVVRDAQKRHDPNHLYLGCRFAWRTPEAVTAAGEYCDVVSFNIYRSHVDPRDWEFVNSLNKPCIIGEFHFGAVDRGMFHTGLVAAPDQKARAQMYRDYVRSVADHPAFVGCGWFQYFDEPLTGRTYDGENYNIGLVDVTDTPYPEMIEAARSVHAEAYGRRYGIQGAAKAP